MANVIKKAEAPAQHEVSDADIAAQMKAGMQEFVQDVYEDGSEDQAAEVEIEVEDDDVELVAEEAEPTDEYVPSEDEIYAELDDTAKTAWDKGWRPKELFAGEENKWVDADKFLDREPFFEKISDMNKQLKSLRKELDLQRKATATMAEMNKHAHDDGFKAAMAKLKAQRKEAFEDSDYDQFDRIDQEMQALQEEHQSRAKAIEAVVAPEGEGDEDTPSEQPQANPEVVKVFSSWQSQNKWFTEDPEAATYANAVAQRVVNANPDMDEVEKTKLVLRTVTQQVQKRFPEHFKSPAAKVGSPVAAVQSGGRAAKSSPALKMTRTEREIMDRIVSSGAITREEYLKQFTKNRG